MSTVHKGLNVYYFSCAAYHIQLFHIHVASDMSLTSKPSWTTKARAEEFRQLGVTAGKQRKLAEWYACTVYTYNSNK